MDADRFDRLARALTAAPSRRSVLGLALTGAMAALHGLTDAEARKRKKKKKKKCKAGTKKCGKKCIAAASCCSAADCGNGGACAGGVCVCGIGFENCQGGCIPDADCCTNADCDACESCQDGACVFACQADQECVDGQCRCTTSSCAGCCDGNTCRSGTSDGLCGIDGELCIACTGGKTCQDGICVCTLACCGNGDCPPGDICVQNQCLTGQGTCATGADECLGVEVSCNGNPECFCTTATSGETRCGFGFEGDCDGCTTDAQCAAVAPGIPGIFCAQGGGLSCCTGFCVRPCPS